MDIRIGKATIQSLKGDFRNSLRRTRRRLAQRGNLSFEAVTKPEEFRPVINWLFSHKAEWLVRTKQDGLWKNAELYKEFLIHVAAEREEVGDVTLFVLKLDGQIISAVLTRNSKSSAEAVIAAFDPAYSKYGPGQLLYEDILKWAFKRRLEFDFRIGDQPYKRHWINRESTVITYRFINSIWGAAFSLASRFRAKSKSLQCKFLSFRPTDP